jgi:hypothetical protein
MKKEDIEDTSMNRHWKPARPAPSWNPWGQLPAPQRGGGGEEESCAPNTVLKVCVPCTRCVKGQLSPFLLRKLEPAHTACDL